MKKNILFLSSLTAGLFILSIFSSCNTREKHHAETKIEDTKEAAPELVTGTIVDKLTSGGSSYSYYIPASQTGKEKLPVMIFFDPHAKGSFPLRKYQALADKFGFILLGSNDSKNGMDFDQSRKIAGDLLNEAGSVLPGLTGQISLAGFSGGAKAALVSGNTVPGFKNVIYCGAALPPGSIDANVPMMAFAGTHDMNYTEVRNYHFSLDQSGKSHTLIEWKGKHEWPDTIAFAHAFYWCIFNSMRNKIIVKDEKTITEFQKMLDASVNNEKNPLVKSLFLKEGIEMLQEIIPTDNYKIKFSSSVNSQPYKEAKKKQDLTLAYEDERKKEFMNAFEDRDLSWWNKQIAVLSADTNKESNQRMLGYISLASWSYSSKAVAANNAPFAQKALQVYKLADPENSEQPFLEACLYSKNGMPDSAIYFINESIKLGLDDRSKIENEKDLFILHGRSDFQELMGKLR